MNNWQKLVKPFVDKCKIASTFNQELVWTSEGADSLGKLLETMAKSLDDMVALAREARKECL